MDSQNNKRIAKNSIYLYIRMLLVMGVTLYTSRVFLNVLGVTDFGIYNVVGGVIALLGFINASLSGASSRFITFVLGKGDLIQLKKTYSTILFIHIIIALMIILIGETVGLWFVLNKLVIPESRLTAALWVYHCSIFTTVASIISIPYNSLIIAHEKMSVFAYISIIEVMLKLLIVLILIYIPYDKLIIYAIAYLMVQILIRSIYARYCNRKFEETRTKLLLDKSLVKEIAIYAGWTINGNLAVVGYTQGINILLNMFFGPVVNAARGIAVQVQTAVMTFVSNFQLAVKPQMIKSYATEDLEHMHMLVLNSSRYGFYLVLLLVYPIFICTDPILHFWLGVVPEHTANFVKIMLIIGLSEPLKISLLNAIHATGNLKKFQLYEGSTLLFIVPLAYLLLKFYNISAETVFIVYLLVELLAQCIRVWIVLPQIKLPYRVYIKMLIRYILPLLICFLSVICFNIQSNISFGRLILYLLMGILTIFVCILLFGFKKDEYTFIKKIALKMIAK